MKYADSISPVAPRSGEQAGIGKKRRYGLFIGFVKNPIHVVVDLKRQSAPYLITYKAQPDTMQKLKRCH
jgi:hypothetical protein